MVIVGRGVGCKGMCRNDKGSQGRKNGGRNSICTYNVRSSKIVARRWSRSDYNLTRSQKCIRDPAVFVAEVIFGSWVVLRR